ncbi:MAG: methylenetetrahydrofolate--tRNA-(uracil(54)-C(5))-methyltransferase (FADH(2)-oxidizing) TrmFO [Anaerolineaceae bacterium]|nr:methylenetetrahydrofolate--tRNA-(uracil(54)-C(5))-methyltransferase (FADH(2)-oxidizing) TrmFO [Anaerolineaceae bacterium]
MALSELSIIGGGLAGCEAAWQAASAGIHVRLYEMRPAVQTPAHSTDQLAELICSNSLGANQRNRPAGLLKAELRSLDSFLLNCADESAIAAGGALAVDRNLFSSLVTTRLSAHPNIQIIREEVRFLPETPCIIASGPLTSPALTDQIAHLIGADFLYFYDAVAPIVEYEGINLDQVFWASRYGQGQDENGDYLNCPLSEEEYMFFIHELLHAQKVQLPSFEAPQIGEEQARNYFEACLPIEVLAARNPLSLSYGPMRPVGIHNPNADIHPFAVVQLRQENLARSLFNLVGFQTNLTFAEQDRVFRLIPGLENARFVRYGQMHRNIYINAPKNLLPTLQRKFQSHLFFAGQITGMEGYCGNIASGLVAGINATRLLKNEAPLVFPRETMIGALLYYLANADANHFHPMKANFGLLPDLGVFIRSKREKGFAYSKRALKTLRDFIQEAEIGSTGI